MLAKHAADATDRPEKGTQVMPNPSGKAFVVYSRRRSDEVQHLVEALHEHGIPTWQDINDLQAEPAEPAIRAQLHGDDSACAILWLTPEVAGSSFIRDIEALEAFRCQRDHPDDFFVVPVAAGGLDYDAAQRLFDGSPVPVDLRRWNIQKVAGDPIDAGEAAHVARRVLTQRLGTLHRRLRPDVPLTVGLHTFPTGERLPADLLLEWVHAFDRGRFADPAVWKDRLLPALEAISATVARTAPGRGIAAQGGASLSSATAFGRAFASTTGTELRWRQVFPDGAPQQLWSPGDRAEPVEDFRIQLEDADHDSRDLAVLVSIVQSVDAPFDAQRHMLPPYRGIIRAATPTHLTSPGQAVAVTEAIRDAIVEARRRYGIVTAVHLFMVGPAGLAVLLGRRLTALGTIHLYEFDQATATYVPSATLG